MLIAATLKALQLTLPTQWLKWETLAHSLAPAARLGPTAERPIEFLSLLGLRILVSIVKVICELLLILQLHYRNKANVSAILI